MRVLLFIFIKLIGQFPGPKHARTPQIIKVCDFVSSLHKQKNRIHQCARACVCVCEFFSFCVAAAQKKAYQERFCVDSNGKRVKACECVCVCAFGSSFSECCLLHYACVCVCVHSKCRTSVLELENSARGKHIAFAVIIIIIIRTKTTRDKCGGKATQIWLSRLRE